MVTRSVWPRCLSWLERKEVLLITGARQTGKTTLLRNIGKHIKAEGGKADYFSLENPITLEAFNSNPEHVFSYLSPSSGKKMFLLIDEIQYLDNPTGFLKFLYDEYGETLKLIVSGSSAFYIDRNFTDSLAGRKRIIELFPFSFSEFLLARSEPELAAAIGQNSFPDRSVKDGFSIPERERLHRYLDEYMTYGGYPGVVTEPDPEEKLFTLRDLHESFLKKDLLEAGVSEEFKLYQLLKLLAEGTGALFNANEAANTLGLSADTVRSYIHILEKAFIIHVVTPFHRNVRKELTKMPRIYFLDCGLRNTICGNFSSVSERTDRGALLENLVFIALRYPGRGRINFWRTQDRKEVDFIFDSNTALEVKWQLSKFDRQKYRTFLEAYPEIPLYPAVRRSDSAFDLLDLLS
jgi:predicted AAA+ superfamily ATPase